MDADNAARGATACALFAISHSYSDLTLQCREGEVHAHKLVAQAAFSVLKDMLDAEPANSVLNLRMAPDDVSMAAICTILCFAYNEMQLPGVSTVRSRRMDMHTLIPTMQYLGCTARCREEMWRWQQCKSCQRHATLMFSRLCWKCMLGSGDHINYEWNDDASDITPARHSPPTYEQVWAMRDRKETPGRLVSGLIAAMRGSTSKTCVTFRDLAAQHLPDIAYRLTAAQAAAVQDALIEGGWCELLHVGVHNMMALPGEFEPRLPAHSLIHCYYGFKDDKSASLRGAMSRSTGSILTSQYTVIQHGPQCTCAV